MIVLSNVSKCYVTQAGEVKALQNVSLSLPERGLVFFVGRSGSGKTTLLNEIALNGSGQSLVYEWNGIEVSA